MAREGKQRAQKVRVPVTLPAGTAPERWLANIRMSSFTLMMLGLLVLAVVVLAPTLKLLIEQQNQISSLEKSVESQKNQVKSLKGQVARWSDPAYIEAQARNRLLFVFPGEFSYLVIPEASDASAQSNAPISKQIQTTQTDWVSSLASSILTSGLTTAPKNQITAPTQSGGTK
ncbi:MAG TPA: septum formation initiator family protein [Galbitalea sp.]|jgi:cell division protein FtsB